MNNSYNRKYTPRYDNDLIQKWYLDEILNKAIYFVGEIKTYMGSKIPDGWLLCNGNEISRNTYKELFNVIGTVYGGGNNVSTFNLPTYTDSVATLGYKIIKY